MQNDALNGQLDASFLATIAEQPAQARRREWKTFSRALEAVLE